jgi:AraC-like DNA-binding protein
MTFIRRAPAAPLQHAVEAIWDWQVEPGEFRFERILPQPGSGLIINLLEDETRVYSDDAERRCERSPGAVFSGQFTRSFVIDSAEQLAVMGVVFRPGGACAFLRERMDVLGNSHTALDDLVANDASALRERLLHTADAHARIGVLEAWLRSRWRPAALHAAVACALDALARAPQIRHVGALAGMNGLSTRRFGTLFREQIGIGAKQYARLQRFRAVVASVQGQQRVEWSEVALDCGFHDQPHLVREFRAFSGMSPGAYVRHRGEYVNHIALD